MKDLEVIKKYLSERLVDDRLEIVDYDREGSTVKLLDVLYHSYDEYALEDSVDLALSRSKGNVFTEDQFHDLLIENDYDLVSLSDFGINLDSVVSYFESFCEENNLDLLTFSRSFINELSILTSLDFVPEAYERYVEQMKEE